MYIHIFIYAQMLVALASRSECITIYFSHFYHSIYCHSIFTKPFVCLSIHTTPIYLFDLSDSLFVYLLFKVFTRIFSFVSLFSKFYIFRYYFLRAAVIFAQTIPQYNILNLINYLASMFIHV